MVGAACPNCRAPITPGTSFCTSCGAPLNQAPAAPAPAQAPTSPAPAPPALGGVPPVAPPPPPPPYGAPPPQQPLPPAFGAPPAPGYAQPAPTVMYQPIQYPTATAGYVAPVVGFTPMSPGIQHAKPMFGPRLIAFIVDALIIGGISALISPIWALWPASWLLSAFFPAILMVGYKIAMESQTSQTLGKMLVGIKVVKEDLKPITAADAQTRNLFILLYPILIPVLMDVVQISEEGLSYGDKWAKTLVVKA